MDRRNFLRQISLTATVAIVAPLVVTKVITENSKTGLYAQIENGNLYYYNKFTQDDLADLIYELSEKSPHRNMVLRYHSREGMLNFHKAMQKAALNYYNG